LQFKEDFGIMPELKGTGKSVSKLRKLEISVRE